MSILLGLGSNLGDKTENIKKGISFLRRNPAVTVLKQSKIIKTKPYGMNDQPDFMNCVVEIKTVFNPHELLKTTKKIEKLMGRERKEKWGPRIIDIDILFFDNQIVKSLNLTIPHPEVHKRYFVLKSLREIVPDMLHPLKRKRIIDLYRLAKIKHENNEQEK